jgi:MYXO-CTERM domain-containing protein
VAAYTVLQSGGGGAPGTWSSSTYNALYTNSQALAGAEGASQLIIRFRATGAASGSSGSNRIDNVIISGDAVPAPGAVALLAVAGLASRRRR